MATARSRAYWTPKASCTCVIPTVMFILSSAFTAINGHKKRFQAAMKVMIAKAVVMPQFIGK